MEPSKPLQDREIIIEMIPLGAYVRVSAMDVETMTEVSIQGPKSALPSVLKANAMRRLEYVMRKNGIIS